MANVQHVLHVKNIIKNSRSKAMSSIQERIKRISRNDNLTVDTKITTCKIELTGICTLKCHFCNNSSMKKNNERQKLLSDHDFEEILSYVSKFDSLQEIGLFYMGESGLHPHLATYYKILKDNGYFTYLTTNGTYIDNVIKAIPYIDSLKVSWNYKNKNDYIDNFASKSSCEYEKIIDNIETLYKECHKHNKRLAISTVLDTSKEEYLQELEKLSFDEHYWIPLQSQGGCNAKGLDGVVGEVENQVSPLPCWSLFKGLYIDCDLNIRTCCYGHEAQHILGNIKDGNIKDTNTFKQQQLEKTIPSICHQCLRNQ